MPNGHDYSKEYGGHKYADHDGTSDCKYGCGCSMGPSMSHGPTGLDPDGECPNNPKDGKRLPGNADYEIVVERRIRGQESRAFSAEQAVEKVSTSKKRLAEGVANTKKSLAEKTKALKSFTDIALKWGDND